MSNLPRKMLEELDKLLAQLKVIARHKGKMADIGDINIIRNYYVTYGNRDDKLIKDIERYCKLFLANTWLLDQFIWEDGEPSKEDTIDSFWFILDQVDEFKDQDRLIRESLVKLSLKCGI